MAVRLKDLKPGDFFTLRPVEYPKPSQVYIRREYDRSEKKFWVQKYDDISAGKLLRGDREVYTGLIF